MTCSQIITINDYTTTHLDVWGVDLKEQLQIPDVFLIYKVETISTLNRRVFLNVDKKHFILVMCESVFK